MKHFKTLHILKLTYDSGEEFKYSDVREIVYPIRSRLSTFKSQDSFDGTILRELQVLEGLNYLKFHAKEGRPGVYSLV